MRSYIMLVLAALIAFAVAMPITPSAPTVRQRAEQYRLQGLREFEIAERLTTPISTSDSTTPILTLLVSHVFSTTTATDDTEGDIAPGSLAAPQMLPLKAEEEKGSLWGGLCALFSGRESSFGYEGKEGEMRRPTGMRHWKQSFGGFRR